MKNTIQKSYKVTIFNESYTLMSTEQEELLTMQAVSLVDTLMKEISQQYQFTDSKKIAVLAAIRLAYDVTQLRASKGQEKAVFDLLDRALASL